MSLRREFGGVRWSPHGMVHVDPSGGRSRNRVADGKKKRGARQESVNRGSGPRNGNFLNGPKIVSE